jgi:hypothetical protein
MLAGQWKLPSSTERATGERSEISTPMLRYSTTGWHLGCWTTHTSITCYWLENLWFIQNISLVTQRLICTLLDSQPTGMSCHPNTDLQTNSVHHPQTDIVTQRLICTQLLSKSRDISFHPNTDLHKTRFTIQRNIFVTQRLLYRDKLWFTIQRHTYLVTQRLICTQKWFTRSTDKPFYHPNTDLQHKLDSQLQMQSRRKAVSSKKPTTTQIC